MWRNVSCSRINWSFMIISFSILGEWNSWVWLCATQLLMEPVSTTLFASNCRVSTLLTVTQTRPCWAVGEGWKNPIFPLFLKYPHPDMRGKKDGICIEAHTENVRRIQARECVCTYQTHMHSVSAHSTPPQASEGVIPLLKDHLPPDSSSWSAGGSTAAEATHTVYFFWLGVLCLIICPMV